MTKQSSEIGSRLPGMNSQTLGLMFIAGFFATNAFDLWGQLISPAIGFANLSPHGLAKSLLGQRRLAVGRLRWLFCPFLPCWAYRLSDWLAVHIQARLGRHLWQSFWMVRAICDLWVWSLDICHRRHHIHRWASAFSWLHRHHMGRARRPCYLWDRVGRRAGIVETLVDR